MIYIDLLVICLMVVFVIDLSGFVDDGIEPLLGKIFKTSNVKLKKPWGCSLCMSHHINLLYIIITGTFSIPMWGYVCLLSFMTPVFNNLLIGLRDFLIKITNNIK